MKKIIILLINLSILLILTGCFSLEVVEYIEFVNEPAEMYVKGTTLDKDAFQIRAKLTTSVDPIVLKLSNSEVTTLGLDFTSTGRKTVTVKYKGVTISANYYVVDEIINTVEKLMSIGTDNDYSGAIVGLENKKFSVEPKKSPTAADLPENYTVSPIIISNGIRLVGQTGTIIEGTAVSKNFYIITLEHGTIENVQISSSYGVAGANNNASGIYLNVNDTKNVSILNSQINNCRSGIQGYIRSGSTVTIEGNVITGNRTGILVNEALGQLNLLSNQIVGNKTFGMLFYNIDVADTKETAEVEKSNAVARRNNAILLNNVNIKKNVFADNWYAQIESRTPDYKIDISQNYFGSKPNVLETVIAQETPHPSDGGAFIQRPLDNRNGNLYFPNLSPEGELIFNIGHSQKYISGGYVLNSYYTDIECTNLVNYNPQD